MADYLKIPFPDVEDVIDGHIHMHMWYDKQNNIEFLHGLEEYRKECGLKYIALAPLPSGNAVPVPRDVSNNIICAFYKLLNKDTFSYGGYIYPSYPAKTEEMDGMDLATQYKELMEIGFDGIKMLEGKPNLYVRVGKPLDSEMFEPAFSEMEKNGTYILMHVRDPECFWTEATEERINKHWYYGNGEYPSFDDLYTQVENVLKKHPRLNLCLAHFFFSAEYPEKLSRLLDTYPNLCVDITPGGEMYIGFEKHPEYFKNFFEKYADRIIFGTDMDFPVYMEAGKWLCDRVYRFLATDEELMSFDDHKLKGIKINENALQKIFSDNLLTKLGGKPREINRLALKRYIEKYKHLIIDKELEKRIDELSKMYL
ncbi:MAG: amidohydrolase family protein [Clostridia bacterium]|nr:amidohydrolase family protein [Clostridia bacterium]